MFRTELTITPQERQLPRTARVLTVGSCFADSMGERLRQNKVQALVNPFGTVFQPLALAQLLRAAAGEEQDWQQHVVEARGRWQSFDFHGSVGADSPVELLQLIQQKVQQVGDFLKQTDLVVLTLGTAWVYRLRETDELVSNLHKLPASLFAKELLTADEVVNALAEVHALLRRINPNIRLALTVSPVRHLKDTLPLNAVSKSVLRVACHYLSELLPGVSYFPAFELLNDDLRDYRFYGADMLHPTEVAEDYVWDKFARAYFDADFGRFRKEWAAVRQALAHRPLHEGALEHRTFLDQTRERLERLVAQGVEVKPELRDVERRLAALPPPRPTRPAEPEWEDDGEERIDIGGGNEPVAAGPVADAAAERTREGRGRNRRGRGRDRDRGARVPEPTPAQPDAPELTEADAPELTEADEAALAYAALDTELLTEEVEEGAETQLPATSLVAAVEEAVRLEEPGDYPAKKKKRRSRGGAKRTARKHAARLAAEQGLPDATQVPEADNLPVAEALAELAAAEAEAPAAEVEVAATEVEATAEVESPLISTPTSDQTTAAAALELTTLPDELPAAPASAPRRRGTGPVPKKSSVITKSSPVKRPKRTALFRSAAAEPAETPVPTPEPVAQAPIISTPIVPETLLERPVVAELLETPLPPTVDETAAPALAKPRRGRPKKDAAAPEVTEATVPAVAAEALAPPPVAAVTTAVVEAPATAVEAPEAAPEKPAAKAARPKRAPKPAAADAAEPPTRRGRPPGTKKAPKEPGS